MAYVGKKPADSVIQSSDIQDGIITSGKLASEVNDLLNILPYDKSRAWNRISETISNAAIKRSKE